MINETIVTIGECINITNNQIMSMQTGLIVLGLLAGLFAISFFMTEIYMYRYFGYIEQTGQSQKYYDWLRKRRLN